MKRIEVVAAIILGVDDAGRDAVFATQRGYGDFAGGWEFPGGKVEVGESAQEALVREIKEELNTTVRIDRFLITVEYDYPSFHLTMHCFIAHVCEGELTLLEHSAAKWLSLESLDAVDWLPADIQVIEAIRAQGVLG